MDDEEKEFTRILTDFQILVAICLALFSGAVAFLIALAELHNDIFLVLTLILGALAILTAIMAINARRKMNKPKEDTQPTYSVIESTNL